MHPFVNKYFILWSLFDLVFFFLILVKFINGNEKLMRHWTVMDSFIMDAGFYTTVTS